MPASHDRPEILVVCTGNVCRSPYIEKRLQHALDQAWGAGQVLVHSAGTGALAGYPIDPGSAALLQRRDLDGEGFAARDLTRSLIASAALVITATRAHRTAVTRLHPRALKTTHAFRDLAHIAPGLELSAAAVDATPADWLGRVVPALAARRGMDAPLPEADADIIDPFRAGPEVFDQMAQEIEAGLPAIMRVLAPQRR